MKILSVDDNPKNRLLIEKALNKKFEVVSSDGNDPIIQLMEEHQPSIVLMDIMLENGLSGYDLVKQIREDGSFEHVVIIFISALTSSKDKLDAYASGGDDYISKPVDLAELNDKLSKVEQRLVQQEQLKEQLEMASNTAFTSMQQASELGQLVTFFSESQDDEDIDSVFARIKQYCINYGFSICCEFRISNKYYQYSSATLTDLEKEILELGRTAKRIVPFGANMMFNSPECSLLCKNIPVHDDEALGRFRDNLAILLTIVDSRVSFIEAENERLEIRHKAVAELTQTLESDFSEIKALCVKQEKDVRGLLDQLMQNFQIKLITLGLDEEQESDLLSVLEEVQEQTEEAMGISYVIEDKLEGISKLMRNLS